LWLVLLGSIVVAPALTRVAASTASAPAPRGDSHRSSLRTTPGDPIPGGSLPRAIIRQQALSFASYSLFLDPDENVVCKEFTLFYNTVPDPARGPGRFRGMFHIIYQRSSGPQEAENWFGHAWSTDLLKWAVDTSAFTVDATAWNSAHVWSPSLVHHGDKDYLFYTGVDARGDQRIGYATTSLLDTTDTFWDLRRVKVWEASSTRWAVPQPSTYGFVTQFRDPYVTDDPEHPGRLLMFFSAHDSTDFKTGQGGLAVGVARSEPGTVDVWKDLGYYPGTTATVTGIPQLEGPHLVPLTAAHTGWRLMYSNAGSPPGETGQTTIRFQKLAPGASVADTTRGNWGAPDVLMQYLHGDPTVFGWSGSEYLRVGDTDFLAGFTAWGPHYQGIAITRMRWQNGDFTLGGTQVTAVDEYRSSAKTVRLAVEGGTPPTRQVRFVIDSPLELDARLDVFDPAGRRVATLLAGRLASGRSTLGWDLAPAGGGAVPNGVYFARLSFAGGARVARLPVVR
jgi:hypothetical protein